MHGDNMLYLGKIRSEIDTMLAFPCGEASSIMRCSNAFMSS